MKHILRISNRFFSACAGVMLMLCCCGGAWAKTVYLNPNCCNWAKGDERYAVYCFGNGETWYGMTEVTGACGGPIYQATVDDSYPNLIFCRMDGGTTENNWGNKWDQTFDITAANGIYCTITGKDESAQKFYNTFNNNPFAVCVSGTWLHFKGETISLSAAAVGATNFQWYKNGTPISGATSSTYTKTNCDYLDGGTYTCKAWVVSGQETTSNEHGVRVPRLAIQTGGGGDRQDIAFVRANTSAETATCEVYLGVAWDYEMMVIDGVDSRGNTGTMTSDNCTNWTMGELNNNQWCRIHTTKEGTYRFTVSFSNTTYTPVKLSATYPPMVQTPGIKIYMENTPAMQARGWSSSSIYYRIGKGKYDDGDTRNWTAAQLMALVPGTDRYLYTTTPDWSNDFWVWHIANNAGWVDGKFSIYKTKTEDSYAITESSNFNGDEVTSDRTIYLYATSGGYGQDGMNSNCQFYGYTHSDGMVTHNVSVGATTNGQIKVEYTHHDNTAQTSEAYTARNFNNLAHTCILTITGVPDCGYKIETLTVNGVDFTSGSTHILTADATIAATFSLDPCPITYHENGGTINGSYPTEYIYGTGATLPTDVTQAGKSFEGWYDNSGCTGTPVTEITTSDCGNKVYWAKWGLLTPEFTWTYDANVKAGGIYPVSVSSTGDANVSLSIVETISGVTGSFTAGNPAMGNVAIGFYPNAITYTLKASSPATATYKAKEETRTVTIEICETPYELAYGVGYTDGGSSSHPRYFHETVGVGRISKDFGGSSNAGSDASWTGESWITKSNKSSGHLLQTYKDGVVKITYYVMAGSSNTTISKLRISDSYISSDSQGSDGLASATIIYNNDPSKADLDKNVQEVVTIILATPLAENGFIYIKFNNSSTVYGAKLYCAEGNEVTSLAFSGETTVEKFEGDAPFIKVATQTTTPIKSGGSITYSSSDETVATVNKNTGEVTPLQSGNARIIATLNAYGCFMKATAEYTLRVKTCTDPECTIAVTSGKAMKCAGASVTMTATAAAGATFQWYQDGVAIPGETNATLTTTEAGDYYVEARKSCLQTSNTITVSDLGAPTAVALHDYYYIRAGRVTPDIALFQLTNVEIGNPAAFTMNHLAPLGCSYELRDDGIVYLTGMPDPSLPESTYDLKVTAHNDCGFADATATLNLRQIIAGKIAWVADGSKGQALPGTVAASKSTSHVLYQYLQNYFDLTPVNAYCTIDTNAIKDYYSQFDLVLLTDYPDTNTKPDGESGGKEKSYSNALGCLIDEKPILTFEAFVADCPNWGINSNPKTPNPKQKDITLLCAAHDIFNGTMPVGEKIEFLTTTTDAGNALQGFSALEAPSGMIFIATIDDNTEGTLIVCCERQKVISARMMMMGLNHDAMGKVSDDGKLIIKQIIIYLLNPNTMADCALIFDNATGDHQWSTPGNWAPSHNAVPKPFQAVRIEQDCEVDVTDAHCSSIRLVKGTKGLETYDAHLTILPGGGLTVTDFIKEVHDANFMTTYPISSEDLIIQASASGQNGSLVFGNESEGLAATVEYQSIASGAPNAPSWQYMGIPIIDRPMAIDQYYAAWMCSWESVGNVSSNWRWVENEDRIMPFTGYCITQAAPKKYTHVGTLNAPETKELTLQHFTSVDGDGFNMFANSWVAPIDITKMKVADFGAAAEATIFIYNTGTRAEYEAGGSPSTAGTNTGVGQFNAIPVAAASYLSGSLTKIPSMQGFFVQATKSGTLTLDYNRICFNTADYTTTSETMRAPRRMFAEAVSEEQIVPEVMRIDVTAEHFGDRVYILAHPEFSEAFDRGWDGSKQEGDADAPMLAFVEGNRLLAVAAVQTADERYLSFRAGQDEDYTFTFEYEGETLYLYDRVTQQATEIRTGNTYSFSADNQAAACRFLITANPPHETTTAIENADATRRAEKIIHEGRLLILYGDAVFDALGERVERKEGAK